MKGHSHRHAPTFPHRLRLRWGVARSAAATLPALRHEHCRRASTVLVNPVADLNDCQFFCSIGFICRLDCRLERTYQYRLRKHGGSHWVDWAREPGPRANPVTVVVADLKGVQRALSGTQDRQKLH